MNIGVVGYGVRAAFLLKNFITYEMDVQLVAVCDTDIEKAKKYIDATGFPADQVNFYDTVEEMIENNTLDGVVISTQCNTHTDLAIRVMKYNIPLLLEKPVAIDFKQLNRLKEACKNYKSEAVVSFPLRFSPLCQLAKDIITSGKIGKVQQVQAVNNVAYGRVYYHSWYRDETITGGLFLQKATHDLDYIHYLIDDMPVRIVAVESKGIFKGDKPTGLKCKDCEVYTTCEESSYATKHRYLEGESGPYCAFAKDTGNHDSGSILIQYDTGIHSVYTQNFIVRKEAGTRGARLIGYKGTIEFDWEKESLKVYYHMENKVEIHEVKTKGLPHFGGDKALCENFVGVMKKIEHSKAPLEEGIKSASMCLYAKQSVETGLWCELAF